MRIILFILLLCLTVSSFSQDSLIYHPWADVRKETDAALTRAAAENKHVFLLAGGNWCKWCRIFEKFRLSDYSVDSMFNSNFVVVHVNYSKENRNLPFLKSLGFPQRFGFPVFVILDNQGNRLHTQNTGYLEDGQGYSHDKVMEFLEQWSPDALKEEHYYDH